MSDETTVFVHRMSGGGCYSLILLMLVFPVMALGQLLAPEAYAPMITLGGVGTVLGLAVVVWFAVRVQMRLEIGPASVRLVERESVLGIRRSEQVLWDCPLSELTHAKEVHTRTPSSRGGWNHGYALHFPGKREIRGGLFGSRDDPNSDYNRIKAWLRERVGDRFTTEEKL